MPPNPIPNPSWLGLIILSVAAKFRRTKDPVQEDAKKGGTSYSVLIPARNEDAVIGDALTSLSKQSMKPERVVVLDDNSDCDYRSIVEDTFPNAEIVRSAERLGKALNISSEAKRIESDYLLVLDADSTISPDYMEKILKRAPFDVAFGTILPDPKSKNAFFRRERLIEYTFGQVVLKRAFNLMGSPNITGCFAVYDTGLLKARGFPARTVTEDLDLTWSVIEKEGKVLYVSDAVGFTKEPETFFEYSRQVKRWYSGFWQCLKVHGASGVGSSNRLTLSLNFVLADQVILAPIWFAFLLGSILLGLSMLPWLAPLFKIISSNTIVGTFISGWLRWFPFAANIELALASILFDLAVTGIVTTAWARRFGASKQAIGGLPIYYGLSWYNRFAFWFGALKTIRWSPSRKGTTW